MLTCQPHVIASRIHGFCWRKITLPFVFLFLVKKIHRSLFGPPKLQTSIGIQKGHAGLTPFFHRCRGFQRLRKSNLPTPPALQQERRVSVICRFLPVFYRSSVFFISHQGTSLDTATLICAMGPSRRKAFATIVTMPLQTRLTMRVVMYYIDYPRNPKRPSF